MKIERLSVQSCCKTTTVAFRLSSSLSMDYPLYFVNNGFTEAKHFTKAGMLYVENNAGIITGTFGSNIVHLRCKIKECADFINNIEQLLINKGQDDFQGS